MGNGTLTIYNASAGSGKTFRLTVVYLSFLIRNKFNYRKILAVTFTNKATAEMKGRILDQLFCLGSGIKSDYMAPLIRETGKNEEEIRAKSAEILDLILHDFSRFSVNTIDAFFQKLLRAFAHEAGLGANFSIEIDHKLILNKAVDNLLQSCATDNSIRKWLTEYTLSNLEDEKSWNLRNEILRLSDEIFRESYKVLSFEERERLEDKNILLQYIASLKALTGSFENFIKSRASLCLLIFDKHNLSDDMFFQKSRGIPKYIRDSVSGKVQSPNNYVREVLSDPPVLVKGVPHASLQAAINDNLAEEVRAIIRYYDSNVVNYNTAKAILKNVYALGILSDVSHHVHLLTTENNTFLLSDAGAFLNQLTDGDQAPFIYEKTGSSYEIFMIDEFQDTSTLQWNNFRPLIENSMSEGHESLVVGDVKQSIYRWRNSNWENLAGLTRQAVGNSRLRAESLLTNWRSRSEIIKFNNALFSAITGNLDLKFIDEDLPEKFTDIYSDVVQTDPKEDSGGYVRIEFIDGDSEDEITNTDNNEVITDWKDKALGKIPGIIERAQDNGYKASDIGILVRHRKEGEDVIRVITEYASQSPPEKLEKYNYTILSGESLTLANAHGVSFVISVLRVINNNNDQISRAATLRYYFLATGLDNTNDFIVNTPAQGSEAIHRYMPWLESLLNKGASMPLYELVEEVIGLSAIGQFPGWAIFLSTLQDTVLTYPDRNKSNLAAFLEWWDSTGSSRSVILPEGAEASRVFTVHKSKGLEFGIVIIPFLSWNTEPKPTQFPIMWENPTVTPFNDIGLVPVKYGSDLPGTIFAESYRQEKFSSILDNLNLLYVAMTRARDAMFGFTCNSPTHLNGISKLLTEALKNPGNDYPVNWLFGKFDPNRNIFESGSLPVKEFKLTFKPEIAINEYVVSAKPESLRLKLHGENYFTGAEDENRKKIRYGRLMHELFEKIVVADDLANALNTMMLEGRIGPEEKVNLENRFMELIKTEKVSEWFDPGNIVLNEASILVPGGEIRRPDRVVIRNKTVIVIDFKFGEQSGSHINQVVKYKNLLHEMGHERVEGYVWYVDESKIVAA